MSANNDPSAEGEAPAAAAPAPARPHKKAPADAAKGSQKGVSLLPISRVHRIIKADKEVRLCSKEAIFLISKATEFMLGKLINNAYSVARLQKRAKSIKYEDLASATSRPEWFYLAGPFISTPSSATSSRRLTFPPLADVIPRTIPLSTALSLRASGANGASTIESSSLIDPSDENHPSHPSTSGGVGVGIGAGPSGAAKGGRLKKPISAAVAVAAIQGNGSTYQPRKEAAPVVKRGRKSAASLAAAATAASTAGTEGSGANANASGSGSGSAHGGEDNGGPQTEVRMEVD